MISARLTYRPLEPALLDEFHALVSDEYIHRYLLDGQCFAREWSAERVAESQALIAERGVGLWLAAAAGETVGFCGFMRLMLTEPELVYALREAHAGRGYAEEMARVCIASARHQPGFGVIHASVDAVNTRSVRLLHKLGFEAHATQPGAFGDCHTLRLPSVARLDHVQLAMPPGREFEARAFYEGVLGIPERPKPEPQASRGGAWFESRGVKVHLGVEADFRPAKKAHPGLVVEDMPALLERLRRAGFEATEADGSLYVNDPFGNRLELVAQ
jgi:RimJ/RimL family protein N-acetyltransferase